jgi:hypothetical protein
VEVAIQRKLIEEAANEQAAAKSGVSLGRQLSMKLTR